MGKALLLIVAAAIGSGIMALQIQETEWRTAGDMAASDANFLAREAARSGYEVGMSEVAQAYTGRATRTGVSAEVSGLPQGGSYDLSVVEQSDATIAVTSTGQARFINTRHEATTQEYRMQGNVARLGQAPSAVLIDAYEIQPTVSGTDFIISGEDRRPGGTLESGAGSDAFGVLAIGPGVADAFQDVLSDEQKERIGGRTAEGRTSPITQGTEDSEDLALIEAIYDEAIMRVSNGEEDAVAYAGNQTFAGTEDFGSSPTNPKIVYIDGDATFTGDVDGHGVLIVDGNLTIAGLSANAGSNFAWEGLVFVREMGEVTYTQTGRTRIDGALVIDSPVLADEESDIEFEIDPDGTVTVNERFAARVEVLGAAISAGGSYDMPVTISALIGDDNFEPWGDYSRAVSSNINDGQNPRSYDMPDIYDAGTEIIVRAKTFQKNGEWQKDWYWSRYCYCWSYQWVYSAASGDSNGDWSEYRARESGEDSDFVKVLRNGDDVPNITGFLNQGSVASFVTKYVANGKVVLEPNQAIYLFELGTTNVLSAAADFQDAVVLLTLAKESEVVTSVPGEGEEGEVIAGSSRVNFNISGEAKVQYSAEAIGRLAKRFSTVNNVATVKALRQRSYNPNHGYEAMAAGE